MEGLPPDEPVIATTEPGAQNPPRMSLPNGMSVEEAKELFAWGRKHPDRKGKSRKLETIRIARTLHRIRNGILLAVAAMGLIIGGANSSHLGKKWKEGFNDKPRGPYPGITLKDPDAQRRLRCLCEEFSDRASLFSSLLPNNKWARENCGDVRERYGTVFDSPEGLARAKNDILEEQDVFDRPARTAPVEWYDYGGIPPMKVFVDEDKLEERQRQQLRATGQTTFELED